MYFVSSLAEAARRWRARNDTRRQLRGLDDHLLRDIGIRRDQIDGFVDKIGGDAGAAGLT